MTADDPYRNELDTDHVDQLGPGNPNVAARPDDAAAVDHEALMGAVDDTDDPDPVADAAMAAVDEDDEQDRPF